MKFEISHAQQKKIFLWTRSSSNLFGIIAIIAKIENLHYNW